MASEGSGSQQTPAPSVLAAIDIEVETVAKKGIGALEAEVVTARMARSNRAATVKAQCATGRRLLAELDLGKTDPCWFDAEALEKAGAAGTSEAQNVVMEKVGALAALKAERVAAIEGAARSLFDDRKSFPLHGREVSTYSHTLAFTLPSGAKAALLAVWTVLGKPTDFLRSQKDLSSTRPTSKIVAAWTAALRRWNAELSVPVEEVRTELETLWERLSIPMAMRLPLSASSDGEIKCVRPQPMHTPRYKYRSIPFPRT